MSEVKTQRRKERQCFCWEVWRKQQEESVLFRVTFVKWALLFQLLHYSNTCYWDQHKEVANINVVVWLLDQDMDEYVALHDSHRCFPANFIYFVLVADVDNCYPMSQWCECLGGHGTFPPAPNLHNAQWRISSAGDEECENLQQTKTRLGVSVCVWLRTIVSHIGLTLQHVLVPRFPQQWRRGWNSLTFSLCEHDLKGEHGNMTGHWKVLFVWCYGWVSCLLFFFFQGQTVCVTFVRHFCPRRTDYHR